MSYSGSHCANHLASDVIRYGSSTAAALCRILGPIAIAAWTACETPLGVSWHGLLAADVT
jgi:hypothetical protein